MVLGEMMEPPQKWELDDERRDTWYGTAPSPALDPPTTLQSHSDSTSTGKPVTIRCILLL